MLKSQSILIEQSKRREKMANIQKADTLSEDGRTELRSLTEAYEGAEVELRAALLVEGAERDKITPKDKATTDFQTECRSFDLTAFVGALAESKALSGREAEVVAELETRHGAGQKGGVRFPWEALETRADVATDTTPAVGGNLAPRATMNALERFFEASAAERFGVRALAVNGSPTFPEITGGTGLSFVAEGAGADAAAITTTSKTPTIKTATGRYLLTRQALRQNSALDMILRRDLSEVLREGIDKAVFQGTGADEQPAGFATILTGNRTAALSSTASFSALLLRAVEIMETAKLSDPSQVRIAGAPILMQTLMDKLMGGTAASEFDRLKSAGFSPVFSSQVSERAARDNTGKGASTVYFGAGDSAFVPTWGSPELIVDPFSESRTGRVSLVLFAFLDIVVQRTATHFFKLTQVQDRVVS